MTVSLGMRKNVYALLGTGSIYSIQINSSLQCKSKNWEMYRYKLNVFSVGFVRKIKIRNDQR